VFLLDVLEKSCVEWVQSALTRLGNAAVLAENEGESIQLGVYQIQRPSGEEVSLARLCRPRLFNLRDWRLAVTSKVVMQQAQQAKELGQDTRKIAICLKSLVSLMGSDASPSSHRVIHVLALGFTPTPQIHKILEVRIKPGSILERINCENVKLKYIALSYDLIDD